MYRSLHHCEHNWDDRLRPFIPFRCCDDFETVLGGNARRCIEVHHGTLLLLRHRECSRAPLTLSLITFALCLQRFSNNFLWGHADEKSLAFTSFLTEVTVAGNLWSSDATGEYVLPLLWIYLSSLAAPGRGHRAPAVTAALAPVVKYVALNSCSDHGIYRQRWNSSHQLMR